MGGLAELVHRDQRVERPVGSLLLDQVTDEADQPDVGCEPELAAQLARGLAVERGERLRVAEVRDRPDRPGEAEPAELVAEVGRERDRGVDAVHDRAPASARYRPPHLGWEAENALPHDQGPTPAAHEHRGLDRATAVRDHDVDRLARR